MIDEVVGASKASLASGGGSGSQWIRTSKMNSLGNFIFNTRTRRYGMVTGFLLDNEEEIFWQRLVADGRTWYLPIGNDDDGAIEGKLWDESTGDWVRTEGSDFPTSPVMGLYWLQGAVEVLSSSQRDDGRSLIEAKVSIREAISRADVIDQRGVKESAQQAQLQEDTLPMSLEISNEGTVDRFEFSLENFNAKIELDQLGSDPHIPLPGDAEDFDLRGLLERLGVWKPPGGHQ